MTFAPACTFTLAICLVITELVTTELRKFELCYGRRRVQVYYQGTNNSSRHNLYIIINLNANWLSPGGSCYYARI